MCSFIFQILIQSVMETVVPKLVAEDIPLLHSLLSDVFPGVKYSPGEMAALRREVKKVCQEMFLVYGEGDELGTNWVEKVTVYNYYFPYKLVYVCEKEIKCCNISLITGFSIFLEKK